MRCKAVVIRSNGKIGKGTDRIILPMFEIVSNPTIRLDDVRKRRFSLVKP